MFEEFRSNLLLLLHCKHPDGMMLDRLESEYLKYFYQTVRPYMFYIEATDWLKVMTETPLRNDTKIWTNNKSEMYIKSVVSRSESEMKLIAKLAKYSHFQYAQSSHFHLDSCTCCSLPLPLSISTKPYGDVFEPTEVAEAACHTKEIDLEEEHLDRGCFMGVIASTEDDLITSEFLESKYNSCGNYSSAAKDSNILNEVKREVSSPTNIENNNYTHEYLMNSQDLELQNHFGDVDISNVKLENDIFTPLESTVTEAVQIKAENAEAETKISDKKAESSEIQIDIVVGATIADEARNYEEPPNNEIVGLKYEPNMSSEPTATALSSNQEDSEAVICITDDPASDFVCEWKDCKQVFKTHQELIDHIPTHTVAVRSDEPSTSQNAAASSSATKASAKDGKSKGPSKRKKAVNEAAGSDSGSRRKSTRSSNSSSSPQEEGSSFHCSTFGCNRSFPTNCKLVSHQRRCCAINDFSCRWPGCSMVFQSSLDLHNHVKIEHRKCTEDTIKVPGPVQIEKNLVLNCSVAACGYAFTCPDRLAVHEKQCTSKKSTNQQNGIFNSNPNIVKPTATATATQGPSSSTTAGSTNSPNPVANKASSSKTSQSTRPKGFARVSKYSD